MENSYNIHGKSALDFSSGILLRCCNQPETERMLLHQNDKTIKVLLSDRKMGRVTVSFIKSGAVSAKFPLICTVKNYLSC